MPWGLAAVSIFLLGQAAPISQNLPLPAAHSHNDYLRPRPLLDALHEGFCSVEADVFLVDGELMVAHDRIAIKPGRTLRNLYLHPLAARANEQGGTVHRGGPEFTLLVDIKANGQKVLPVLIRQLQEFPGVFSNRSETRAVKVIVSGDRPFDLIKSDASGLTHIDGRPSDLGKGERADIMPLISDNWNSHFAWRGTGEMPAAEREKLRSIVARVHAEKKRIRFWASPDTLPVFRELQDAGADLINTDRLPLLGNFLRTPRKVGGRSLTVTS